jgi:hypothetical protein
MKLSAPGCELRALAPALRSDLDLRHLLNEKREISIPDMATTLSQTCRDVVAHHLEALCLLPFVEDLVRGRSGRHGYDPRGRWIVNVVPWSSDDFTSILPLWACTIWSAM